MIAKFNWPATRLMELSMAFSVLDCISACTVLRDAMLLMSLRRADLEEQWSIGNPRCRQMLCACCPDSLDPREWVQIILQVLLCLPSLGITTT
ncbi:hypothetical protein EV424DRAFT_1384594 [Suillus variegatus]|nr:hypothetical protein EV424DRAFT_1384594 [Suillus variegatus]